MPIVSLFRSICLPAIFLLFAMFGATDSARAQGIRDDDATLKARLAKDKFFSNHRWERVGLGAGTSEASFIVLWDAQDAPVDSEDNPKLLGRMGGWLRAQAKALQDADYLPDEFKARLGKQVVPILILRSQTEYERWQIQNVSMEYRSTAATYSPKLGALVCHLEKRGIGQSAHDLRNFILHLHARQLIAQAAPSLAESGSQWLVVGLSELVSSAAQTTAKETIEPYLYRQGLRNVIHVQNDPADRKRYWIPVETIFGVQGAQKRLSLPIDMKVAGKSRKTLWGLLYYFDQQAMLWMHYLLGNESGKEALARCVQEAIQGPMAADAALKNLGFANALAAEKAMGDWLESIAKPVGGIAIKKNPGKGRVANGKTPNQAQAASMQPEPPAPAKPTLQPLSTDQILALALTLVRQGQWADGLGVLESALDADSAARFSVEDQARIQQEILRVQATLKGRDKFLESTVANGKRLRFTQEGKGVMIQPTGWKDGILSLNPSRKCPLPHLDSNQMGPEFLALNWKKLPGGIGPDWLYGYVSYLSGDKRWRRALRDTKRNPSQELQALGDWTSTGELVEFLHGYEEGKPKGLHLDRLTELCNSFFMGMELTASEPLFRAAIRQEIDRTAANLGPEDFLAVKPESLADGAIRLTYPFDDASELGDFMELPKLWEDARRFPDDPLPEDQVAPQFVGGAMQFTGERRYGHRLNWTGPIHIRYRYELVGDEVSDPTFFLWFGVRVQPKKAWLRSEFHTLVAYKGPRKRMLREVGEGVNTAYDEVFDGTLSWDGDKAHHSLNGKPAQEIPFPSEDGAAVVFWSESEFRIKIHDLTIEGTVDPTSMESARQGWVSARMSKLGFSE
ncbi:MAG: hypothetical protein P1V35_12645 [Planctomycetota bacterium]|nr:hypothetical protein [Planctomycetota bacterium]